MVFVLDARHNEEGGDDWRGRDAFFFLINICTANIHSTMLIVPIHIPSGIKTGTCTSVIQVSSRLGQLTILSSFKHVRLRTSYGKRSNLGQLNNTSFLSKEKFPIHSGKLLSFLHSEISRDCRVVTCRIHSGNATQSMHEILRTRSFVRNCHSMPWSSSWHNKPSPSHLRMGSKERSSMAPERPHWFQP